MANYFRWKKGKRDEDVFYSEKPRSRSLDPRSLELSGIRVVAHQHHLQQLQQQQAQVTIISLGSIKVSVVEFNYCVPTSIKFEKQK